VAESFARPGRALHLRATLAKSVDININRPVAATVPLEITLHVRDTCLCLHTQRAARALAARFDAALREVGLTNRQFSLLNALNGPTPKTVSAAARVIGADRTTVTAALKPLVRQGLAKISPDSDDRRVRRVALTAKGHARLAAAVPVWTRAHQALEAELAGSPVGRMQDMLVALSAARGLARP
jgi:DNA-binding MarR family transcriptional regulator